MRDPDKTSTLDPGCAALRWTTVGPEVARTLAAAFGVEVPPEAATATELSDSELEVRCWRMLPRDTGTLDHQGFVGGWIVNGPYNPLWRWWQIAVVHLRPIPGVKAAHVRFPGASHEVMIASIDPTSMPEVDVDALERGELTVPHLSPFDLVHQVILRDDLQGAELLDLMIEPILTGDYSPDQDFRSAWESILDRTAEHLRLGDHPDS